MFCCCLSPSHAQDFLPLYVSSKCPYFIRRLAEENYTTINCGHLVVAENRQASDNDRFIELFVARVAAKQPVGNAPIVYLAGGPGSAATEWIEYLFDTPLHLDYEFIMIDLRGSGLSRPSLNCYEKDDQTVASNVRWIRDCYRRLTSEGIDLDAYHSVSIAADIHELLQELDIDQANIYGVSYGSRLALSLMRDFPERIRAVILDGVVPPNVNMLDDRPTTSYQAFEQIFIDCERNPACNRAYPNLRESLYSAITALNRAPIEVEDDESGNVYEMTGHDFVNEIHARLYENYSLRFLPATINAYERADYDFDPVAEADDREFEKAYRARTLQPDAYDLAAMELLGISDIYKLYDYYWDISDEEWNELIEDIQYTWKYEPFKDYVGFSTLWEAEHFLVGLDEDEYASLAAEVIGEYDTFSEGLRKSAECAEEVHFNDQEIIWERADKVPSELRKALVDMSVGWFTDCNYWRVAKRPDFENQPVHSAIPTLLLSGSYDPITPPQWADEAANYLTKSWQYVVPDSGHGSLFLGGCADTIMASFLAYPQFEPRAECIADMSPPDFYIRK